MSLCVCPGQAERVRVDAEEAKFQAKQRKEAIERAKTLLYYQTDRLKQFHVSHHTQIRFTSTSVHCTCKASEKLHVSPVTMIRSKS